MRSVSNFVILIFITFFVFCGNFRFAQGDSQQSCGLFWGYDQGNNTMNLCKNSGGAWYKCDKTRGNPQFFGRNCRAFKDGNPNKQVDPSSPHGAIQCSVYAVSYEQGFTCSSRTTLESRNIQPSEVFLDAAPRDTQACDVVMTLCWHDDSQLKVYLPTTDFEVALFSYLLDS
ncbi:hypothetical protein CROQUDRAFT_713611 [Cronartium quercuum f. sp. fusiforme G11]|uniref:Secreted protein n=1 Tax=Cronartium quercuum f. sp. fusiforme G11 TaxID=708437 RepID=A0A9P6NVB2_9BASI|nr:hypothetical protein CROQUDRAFT_713611 [Cronartium quercuum f. sp. fusiforme G11]